MQGSRKSLEPTGAIIPTSVEHCNRLRAAAASSIQLLSMLLSDLSVTCSKTVSDLSGSTLPPHSPYSSGARSIVRTIQAPISNQIVLHLSFPQRDFVFCLASSCRSLLMAALLCSNFFDGFPIWFMLVSLYQCNVLMFNLSFDPFCQILH